MKTVIIRQPGYMPNLNFFKKIQSCDVFVYLDNVQFSKDSFDNRNRIKTQNGVEWITVPLQRPVFGKKLNQVSITYDSDWIKAHSNLIFENYKSALKIDSKNAEALCNLGNLYYTSGNLEEAKKNLELSIEIKSELDASFNNLGLVDMAYGNFKSAKKNFIDALRINSINSNYHSSSLTASVFESLSFLKNTEKITATMNAITAGSIQTSAQL